MTWRGTFSGIGKRESSEPGEKRPCPTDSVLRERSQDGTRSSGGCRGRNAAALCGDKPGGAGVTSVHPPCLFRTAVRCTAAPANPPHWYHSTALRWPTRPAALALAAPLCPWALSSSFAGFQTHLGAKHAPASDPLHLPSPLSGKLSLSHPQGVSPSLPRGFLVRSCPSLRGCPVDISTPSSLSAVLFPAVNLHCT